MTSHFKEQRIVAVIPCYNEESHIFEVVNKARQYVHQVIVIDDGSNDRTEELAKLAGAEVFLHTTNRGKGAALQTAFNVLKNLNVDAAVFLDGDGQHDPDEIPKVIAPVISGQADMTVGSRFLNDSRKIPFYRRIGQSVLNIATSLGSGIKLTDSQSGYRAFSRNAIDLMSFSELGLSIESEMQFIAGRLKFITVEVPIKTIYSGELKRSPISHGFGVLFRVIALTVKSLNVTGSYR